MRRGVGGRVKPGHDGIKWICANAPVRVHVRIAAWRKAIHYPVMTASRTATIPPTAIPEDWLDSMARAGRDVAAGRIVDSATALSGLRASIARMEAKGLPDEPDPDAPPFE